MNPFGAGRRADELARVLDGGLPAGAAFAGAPVLVGRLRAAGAALEPASTPRPDFRAALRQRLVAVATVQAATAATAATAPAPTARPAAVSWSTARARRGGTVAAGALASVVAVSGVAVAGSQSLPGDPFYDVKRTTEALQLRFADGPVEKGTRHLDFAATRLREVRGLALGRDAAGTSALQPVASSTDLAEGAALSAGVAERVRDTLADMDSDTRKGTALLTRAYRSSQATEPLQALSRFATRQSAGLETLLPSLPAAARDRARVSLALLTGVATETEELLGLGTCGPACDPSTVAPAPGTVTTDPAVPSAPGTPPCGCTPAPTPAPSATADPAATGGTTTDEEPSAEPSASRTPAPSASPSPQPSSSGGLLPPLPVPVPSLPLPDLPLPAPVESLLPTLGPLQPLVDPLLDPASAPAPPSPPSVLPGLAPAPAARPAPSPTPVPAPTP